jgi:hypothetical protein
MFTKEENYSQIGQRKDVQLQSYSQNGQVIHKMQQIIDKIPIGIFNARVPKIN